MADIIVFTPRTDLDASANLRAFIDLCRNKLSVFGRNLPFDDDIWDVTAHVPTNARKTTQSFAFRAWGSTRTASAGPLAEPFRSFAKAYVRYQYGVRPAKNMQHWMMALRALEVALTENGGDANPIRIDAGILNRAAQLLEAQYSNATAYNVAGCLDVIAEFLVTHCLLQVPLQWTHSLKYNYVRTRVGAAFDARREEKLPSQRALDALANLFHLVQQPGDVLVSAVTAILCSAPDRISEVLALPVDCEVKQPAQDGSVAYGLRWWPAKGASPMVKWVVPSMVGVVEEAIRRIRKLTEPGRVLARWYEKHPDKVYLPSHLEHLRGKKMISLAELGSILYNGDFDRNLPQRWVEKRHLDMTQDFTSGRKPYYVKFADVEREILKLLPVGFPVLNAQTGLKYSDALCVVARSTMDQARPTYHCLLEPITYSHIRGRLGEKNKTSIFDNFDMTEDDGSRIQLNTHQFRHYLNTLAQRGGLSQLDIAKWSGRRDVQQNAAYDHVSGHELVAQLRDTLGDSKRMIGPLAKTVKAALIPRDEFARLKIPTAHTTELGYCIHDYTMSPCQLHRDCISCEELVCVKGDTVRTARIRQLRAETQMLLEAARKAEAAGDVGANRWVEHQTAALERLDQLCTIFDNPTVPDGAFIQQAQPRAVSRVRLAVEARAALLGEGVKPLAVPLPTTKTARKKAS